MDIKDFVGAAIDRMRAAYEQGDKEETLRLLDVLIESLESKKGELISDMARTRSGDNG